MHNPLLTAIQKVQTLIANERRHFENNEPQTIRTLIDPILDSLGWQTSNIQRVQREFRLGSGRADMALINEGKAVAVLEAKALGAAIGHREREQLGRYCFQQAIPTAILTNGAEWRVYRPLLNSLPFEERQLFHIQLGAGEVAAQAAARQLALLAYEEIGELEGAAWRILLANGWRPEDDEAIVQELSSALRKTLAKKIGLPARDIPIAAVRALLREKLGLGSEVPVPAPIPPCPKPQPTTADTGRAVILAGERHAVKYAKDVLIQTVEWLIRKNHFRREDCPIRISEKSSRYLIHSQPRHPNNREFFSAVQLSNGLYLESLGSKLEVIRIARLLVERYGHPPDTLRLVGFED